MASGDLLARDDTAVGGLRPDERTSGDLRRDGTSGDLLRTRGEGLRLLRARGEGLRLLRRAGNGDGRRRLAPTPTGDRLRRGSGEREREGSERRAIGDLEAGRRYEGERESRAAAPRAAFPPPPLLLLNLSVREREFSRLPSGDETERRAFRRVNDTDLRRDDERAVAPPPTGEVGADGEYMVERVLEGCAAPPAPDFFDAAGGDDFSLPETLLLSLSSVQYSSL